MGLGGHVGFLHFHENAQGFSTGTHQIRNQQLKNAKKLYNM
jgi:hypothetical protein